MSAPTLARAAVSSVTFTPRLTAAMSASVGSGSPR
jgi:hypothetical protein